MPNWLTLLKGNFVIIMKTNIVLLLGNETCKHSQNYTIILFLIKCKQNRARFEFKHNKMRLV